MLLGVGGLLYVVYALSSVTLVTCPAVLQEASTLVAYNQIIMYRHRISYCDEFQETLYSYEDSISQIRQWMTHRERTIYDTVWGRSEGIAAFYGLHGVIAIVLVYLIYLWHLVNRYQK